MSLSLQDINNLAPRKVDWDLKRNIEKDLQKLEKKTEKAIADLIRKCRVNIFQMDIWNFKSISDIKCPPV